MPPAPRLAAPVFLIAAAGAEAQADVLLESLSLAAGVWAARAPSLDGLPAEGLAAALLAGATDREGRRPDQVDGPLLAIAGGDSVSRALPELAAAFADARFVLVARDDSQALPEAVAGVAPERRHQVDGDRLLADPRAELQHLCAFAGVAYDQALLSPIEAARRAAGQASGAEALASVSTTTVAQALTQLGGSLLISTYQTGKLVCARAQAGALNTHFRDYDKPMGIAVAPGRIALGTRTEVWDLRNMPEAAPKVEPAGTHDACYLPRNRHVTGDISVHDLAFAGGELWLVATAFSCLATLDAHHSFVPRWAPPFISALAPEDRCHLNGLAVVEDRVAYVTALGSTDEAGGWRAGKATDGVLIDVATSEVAVGGLSMPHSPRWHDGRLWLLESGQGTLCTVDLAAGRVDVIAELPGFTRGLAFAGNIAFVGLSQIRESPTFGGLPLTQRLQERMSGVWMVDLRSGAVVGFLRFDDLVQEIFDVALLPGARYPEIAEATSATTATSYVLP
ncbi:MAG: repeat-containing protein [Solirubrobacteraceae bacterium]|nr:repeat-containing protein [Solirubrobacteraceae bacterium]